jgi:hypothetical protein
MLHDPELVFGGPVAADVTEAGLRETAGEGTWFVSLEVAAVVFLAVWFVSGDVPLGVLSAVLAGVAAAVRSIDRRVPFSYGEGFLGYRSDAGWPRGVQEEDGVRWNWKGRLGASSGDRYP